MTAERRTTIPPAPSLWSRLTRTLQARWIRDPVTCAIVIAALSFLAFGATLAGVLVYPRAVVPVTLTVAAVFFGGALWAWRTR